MVQLTRQPSAAVAFSTTMARPSRFRNLVGRYCAGLAKSRRKRLTREFVPVPFDAPPPLPPKDVTSQIYSEVDDVDAGAYLE